jgi:type I restriction enzyme S subunit
MSIPPHWTEARLGDIADVSAGGPAPQDPEDFSPDGLPFVRVQDMGRLGHEVHLTVTADRITTGAAQRQRLRLVPAGAVLFTKSGMSILLNQRAILGQDSYVVSHIGYLLPATDMSQRWLYWFLKTLDFGQLSHATTLPSLKLTKVADITVPLAPKPEQDRIVAEIEKQFTRLDDAVTALKRVQANLKRYRRSVLKAACEGRLVPTEAELARKEGRTYEPASELLKRILAERRAKWEANRKRVYKEPSPPSTSSKPHLPEGWTWASVSQLGFVNSGNTPKGIEGRLLGSGEFPWFKVGDMNSAGNERCMIHTESWLSRKDVEELGLHVQPEGTIIFPKRGGAIATNKKRLLAMPSTYDLNTMGITPLPPVAAYVWHWFQSINLGPLGDGSNVPQINHTDIEPLAIPLPPVGEQGRIVAELDRCLSLLQGVEPLIQQQLARAKTLRQSILRQAFDGKLVPQDPADEPASALLKRIRAEHSTTVPKAKSPKRAAAVMKTG